MVNIGKDFLAVFKNMMANDYGILYNSSVIRDPQANVIVESLHQSIGNIKSTFTIQQMDIDNESPWEGLL